MAVASPRPDELSFEGCIALLGRIPGLEPGARVEAIERLLRVPNPAVRGAALRVGAAFLSDDQLVSYLRNEADDVLRSAGLEMLKIRGDRSFALAVSLLQDRDSDVVLQALQLLDHLKNPRGLQPLRRALQHGHPNVVQAAIVAIGHLGDARAVKDLLEFLTADPWLQVAAVQALGDARSPAAVRPLERLLSDPVLAPLAAEALGRIGGARAFGALSRVWLRFDHKLESESVLTLLAHVLEGLPRFPKPVLGLRAALSVELSSPIRAHRIAAARSLLAMGPGAEDPRALAAVAAAEPDPASLPVCLARRKDLIRYLLTQRGVLAGWGFLLAARCPKAVPIRTLARALGEAEDPELFGPVMQALSRLRDPLLGPPVLDYYLRLSAEARTSLARLLRRHRHALRSALRNRRDVDAEVRLVLSALLGAPAREVVAALSRLSDQNRAVVISQLSHSRAIMRRLPWREWLAREPARYGRLAAQVAVNVGLRELTPFLRALAEREPTPELLRALGELGDPESVPVLVSVLGRRDPALLPYVLTGLGRIGGAEARRALREAAASLEARDARIAYRALSSCATADDLPFFRQVSGHSDWYVRLACAEVLGRVGRPGDRAVLLQLAADPNPTVAHEARAFLGR
ncbi:MAG: HEAT repeat domain-containing protein [Gemmatimonadetes bacterium]|nr:HEAT repeat domain-containing protein [Gemmatimonadota bacterium]